MIKITNPVKLEDILQIPVSQSNKMSDHMMSGKYSNNHESGLNQAFSFHNEIETLNMLPKPPKDMVHVQSQKFILLEEMKFSS